jgi:hypothetical protein
MLLPDQKATEANRAELAAMPTLGASIQQRQEVVKPIQLLIRNSSFCALRSRVGLARKRLVRRVTLPPLAKTNLGSREWRLIRAARPSG